MAWLNEVVHRNLKGTNFKNSAGENIEENDVDNKSHQFNRLLIRLYHGSINYLCHQVEHPLMKLKILAKS